MTGSAEAVDLNEALDVECNSSSEVTLYEISVVDNFTAVSYTHLDVYKRQAFLYTLPSISALCLFLKLLMVNLRFCDAIVGN